MDFQKLFQFNLPPEALDLKDFVDGFKDKDLGMEYDKENSIKNALEKLEEIINLVPQPEPGVKISAKMMIVD
jgi:hypothetical protein